jgi:hypothetical protein
MVTGSGKKSDRSLVARVLMSTKYAIFLAITLAATILSGCASVKPWERETLSRPGMQIDPDPLMTACDDHIYFSREASKGGRSFGGGGCGCN